MPDITISTVDLEKIMQAAFHNTKRTKVRDLCRSVMTSNGVAGPISDNVPVPTDDAVSAAVANITNALP